MRYEIVTTAGYRVDYDYEPGDANPDDGGISEVYEIIATTHIEAFIWRPEGGSATMKKVKIMPSEVVLITATESPRK